MRKNGKTAVPLALAILLVASQLLCGCSDGVLTLSPEEEEKWMKEQTDLFADVHIPDFEVETVDGNTITADDCFRDYKLTMINIWGTFCGPCIEEMPDIARLYDRRPEGINIISICVDAGENDRNLRFANEVVEKAGAGFETLIPDEVLRQALTERVTAFPTTVFVDSDGKIVGGPYFGAQDEEGYRAAAEERLRVVVRENAVKERMV